MNEIRHNWTSEEIMTIYKKPLMELLYEAATIHRQYHDPNTVQVSTLLSVKTGGCTRIVAIARNPRDIIQKWK